MRWAAAAGGARGKPAGRCGSVGARVHQVLRAPPLLPQRSGDVRHRQDLSRSGCAAQQPHCARCQWRGLAPPPDVLVRPSPVYPGRQQHAWFGRPPPRRHHHQRHRRGAVQGGVHQGPVQRAVLTAGKRGGQAGGGLPQPARTPSQSPSLTRGQCLFSTPVCRARRVGRQRRASIRFLHVRKKPQS
jgi:hypothetical protein